MKRMLDLFCGRLGWSKAFLARGWECVGVDLVPPTEIPRGFEFWHMDVLDISWKAIKKFDFACASSPCDEFSCFQMKHFRKNPPYPRDAIYTFLETQTLLESAGIRHILENVRAAQEFIGDAVNHCGPFYLWGNAVPTLMPTGVTKAKWKANSFHGRNAPGNFAPELNLPKKERKAKLATIPPELANCVADYAERLLETSHEQVTGVPGRWPR